MEMLEEEIIAIEKLGKTIKLVTTNMIGSGYTAEVVYR
jgi:hypothetical protein